MEDKTIISGAILLYLVFLSIIASFKGRKYDRFKKEENRKYSNDHFGSIMGGSFHIALPKIIKEKNENIKLQKLVSQYNFLTRLFWGSVIIAIPIFFWVYST